MPTYWLSTHVGYACRHSGACCTARWPIPIEPARAAAVDRALAAGAVALPPAGPWLEPPPPNAPEEVAGLLTRQASGACVFHRHAGPSDTGGCRVHAWRPVSCEHFPRVCVIDARGVHVTLSHYCPTAAAMLFEDTAVEVVEGPAVLADGRVPEGLDARDALPPVWTPGDTGGSVEAPARPGPAATPSRGTPLGVRLMSWEEVTQWERRYVAALAGDTRLPPPPALDLFEGALAAVPPALSWPGAPRGLERVWERDVAPAWPAWAPAIGRYLAARAHASWAMYHGNGPAAVRRGVETARAVLQVEAARQCARAGRALDRRLLTAAIRESDLLLVHYADPAALARA